MKHEITYERDIYKSYMKIPSIAEDGLDERLMLCRELEGIIPCEKCYINAEGQYWYDISGKQALDNYCKVNAIGRTLFETLILRFCSQLELLEWNLIDGGCLKLEPEMIFLNHTGEEVFFILYPEKKGNVFLEFQRLIEYLLTKLDHGEPDVVQWAYEIYEITLCDGYSIADIKDKILKQRVKEIESNVSAKEMEYFEETKEELVFQETTYLKKESSEELQIENLLLSAIEKGKEMLGKIFRKEKKEKKNLKEEIPYVVYPNEEETEAKMQIHPTICITAFAEEPKGILLYEGLEGFPDFEMGKLMCVIGKSHRVKFQIEKDTISQFHAKIDYIEGNYYIEDMNSTNGTYVNEEMLNYKEQRKLQVGDILRFADVKYRFM